MHLSKVVFHSEKYPTTEYYPFNLGIFRRTKGIAFQSPVAFLVGENGSGKSTLLRAMAHKCGIHMWEGFERTRFEKNPYEKALYTAISVAWEDGPVPGSFFASQIFDNFARLLDEWAAVDPGVLAHFGGKSLVSQSHGQSLLAFFRSRYKIRGLYLVDEPETALSPRSQLALLRILRDAAQVGVAQFIVATHSPILLACRGAEIHSFDHAPVKRMDYEETDHYRIYEKFMRDRSPYLEES